MRHYIEEIKDFPKKGDMFLLVLCLIISGFGLVCIASATSAGKFDGNFRYIALQSFAVLMGAAAYIFISSVDLDMSSGTFSPTGRDMDCMIMRISWYPSGRVPKMSRARFTFA